MRDNWEIKNLGDICDVVGGGTPSKSNSKFYDGKIHWATVRDLQGDIISDTEHKITLDAIKNSSTNLIPKGNVIIATRVGLGKVCLIEHDTAINQDLRAIIPKDKKQLSISFLFQWLKSISHLIVAEGTGATVQGVKLPFIKDLEIPLPPLPEQRRIVSILDEAFAAIAKAKANAEQNLKNAREVYESYLQNIFEIKGKDWEEKTLGEVCTLITDGKHGDCKNEVDSGYYFLSAKDVRNNTLLFDNARQITKKDFEETHRRTNLRPGDICMVNTGATIGRISFAPDDPRTYKSTFQKSVAVIKTIPSLINNNFCQYILISDLKKLVKVSSGTAVPNLLLGDLKRHRINLPKSLKIQESIVQRIDVLYAETSKLEVIYQNKLTYLEELKNSILQKAFSGELNLSKEVVA
jgi:type I restriction enzyme S subunit